VAIERDLYLLSKGFLLCSNLQNASLQQNIICRKRNVGPVPPAVDPRVGTTEITFGIKDRRAVKMFSPSSALSVTEVETDRVGLLHPRTETSLMPYLMLPHAGERISILMCSFCADDMPLMSQDTPVHLALQRQSPLTRHCPCPLQSLGSSHGLLHSHEISPGKHTWKFFNSSR